jgi:hypothetical protein
MALNYGISDHEASWDGAMKYAEVQGWTLANVSPLYLIYLTDVLNRTPGLDGSEGFWVNRRRGWQEPGVEGWYFVEGDEGHWRDRGLTVSVDRDARTLRRFVYEHEA